MKYKLITRIQASILVRTKCCPFHDGCVLMLSTRHHSERGNSSHSPPSLDSPQVSVCYMTPDPIKLMVNIITHNVRDIKAGGPLPHISPPSVHFTLQKWPDVHLLWRAFCIWVNTSVSFNIGHISQIHSFKWEHYSTHNAEDRGLNVRAMRETARRPWHRCEGITMLCFSSTTNLEVCATHISSYF